LKYFNDVIITDLERITSITSDPHYDPSPSKNENYSNGDPGTILESNPKQKNFGVKNFGTGFGLILGPSGILKSADIDDSEETVRDSVEMEENWKERFNVIKEKERKIMRAIEREKERAMERAVEEERENIYENEIEREIGKRKDKMNKSEKVKDINKERIRRREIEREREEVKNVEIDIENDEENERVEERKKRMMIEMKTGRVAGSDIESFVKEQRAALIDKKSRLHDENGNRIIMQMWEKEMGEERERKKEKEREGDRKWDREGDKEEEKEIDREKKKGEKKKDEGRKEKETKGIKNAARDEETITETERISITESVRDSPYSLPSISRVISITPSSSTNTSSSSSSSSPPLPHTASTPTSSSSSPSPSPSTPSSSSSTSNSASLLHLPSSSIPPLIPPQQIAKEIPPPYFDEIELEKRFRQNFNDFFRKIIYETLETVKKEKNLQNN
jgi:hypothetical protein